MADTTVTARFRADTTDLQTKLGALQAQMMATSKRFSSVSQSMVSTGATLTKGVTLPIVAVGTAAVVAGATFEKSMNKVRAVSGATGSDFENMSDTAKELGRTTQFSASQAADGMSFLAMAGFEANDIVSAMPGVLNLAAAGQMDLAQAADIASNVLTGFGMDASELDGAIDVMAKTFTSANTSLDQLGEAMSYVAPIAASAGANFEEVNAAVGLLGNAGIQGSRAGTSLARVMSILTMNSSKTAAQLGSLGVSALDTSGNLLPLESIIGQLERSGATTADVMSIFGQRAGPAMAALLSQGSDALRDLTGDLETSGGTAEEIAETQMEGLAGTMLRLKSAFEGAMIAIAESGVLDALTAVVETAANALSKFTAIWEKVPGPVKTVTVVLAAAAAAMGPILWAGGKVIALLGTMGAAWATLNRRVKNATRAIGTRVKTMELEIKTAMIKSRTQLGAFGAAAGVVGKRVALAFRTMATAAKGLMMSFGPIGIALTGLTVAFEIFMGKSAESEAAVERLRDTVDETTGAFTDLTAAMIAEDLTMALDEGAMQALDKAGITVADMTTALLEGGDAVTEMGEQFNAAIGPVGRFGSTIGFQGGIVAAEQAFGGYAKQLDTVRRETELVDNASKQAQEAVGRSGVVATTAAEGFDDLADSAEDAKTQTQILNDMFSTFDANVAAIRAKDAANAYMKDMEENLGKVAKNLMGESAAARSNRDVVLEAFSKKKAELSTWAEATGASASEVESRWRDMTRETYDTLVENGIDAKQLREFLGENHIDVASVRVANELEGAMGYIGSNVGAEAKHQGTYIGRQMSNGLVAGINAGIPPMERAASAGARAAESAFKREADIRSPSGVFRELGENLMAGLEKGIRDSSDEAAEAARDAVNKATTAATDAIQEWEDYRDSVQDAIVGTLDLGQAYQDYTDRQQAVTDALAELHEYQAEVQGDATDAQKDKLKELQTAYQEAQADAANGAQSIVDEFVEQGKKAAAFTTNLHTLLNNNLSRQAFDAIIREGGERGADIAAALVEGNVAENVRRVNEVYGSVQYTGEQVGIRAADSFYGAGVSLALEALTGIIKEFLPGGKKRKELLRAVRNLDKSIRFEPKYLDIVTRRYEVGQTPPTVAPETYANAAASADVASQFSQSVLNNAQRLNAAHQAGQDVTQLGFNEQDWQALAELERANVAALATGGIVTAPTMALIGEAGPEAVVPLSGRNAPAMGNTTVNVTINAGMGTDGAEVGRQVVEAVRKYERRSGPVFARA